MGIEVAIAGAGLALAAGSTAYSVSEGRKEKKKAEERNSESMRQAKEKAAAIKEASAKRSDMFAGDEAKTNKSLLTAQKKQRLAKSGAQGTRLTGGRLGSPATAGGATLLGQ